MAVKLTNSIPCARHEIGIESALSQFRFDDSKPVVSVIQWGLMQSPEKVLN